MAEKLDQNEKDILLNIARKALEKAVMGEANPEINLSSLPQALQANGASFVTLTTNGRLRGCIGTLEAYQPLALDVQEHAIGAGLQDYRFPNVQQAELANIDIEISVLTPREHVDYENSDDLITKIRPNIDGVVLQQGFRKATFLPQVWDKLPDPQQFLSHLCLKMGAPANLWKKKHLEVFTYQVEEFHE